ncbi:N-acyl homoserine lactonase family protein [Halieaceae bacterium IMCC14734]|uniref:N-acyl homoserine lactonase family protein n=1 Tax=Candidatus Litorirhabdus singularis TaxID=2518993 RepID=A0ABT3TFI7_9GAMM|nr:N-acyl homoserine lactonase family protein [Candidatus Litorirhabdus singularis]MCX2981072.1 N-acyl homoserine lactonase family protein [Candidatus Litorirhabdus singularis]
MHYVRLKQVIARHSHYASLANLSSLLLRTVSLAVLLSAASLASAGPQLTVFDCGKLNFESITAFGLGDDATEVRELFVPCYLIQHEKGLLLWDFGLPLEIAGAGKIDLQPGSWMQYDRSLLQQLKKLALTPDDISFIAPSHMHFDHVGAISAFPKATLLIANKEYTAAFENAESNTFYDLSLYASVADNPRVLLDDDYDVFGDGTVMIIPAPGHTPGHQVLLVRLANTGTVLLSGDLYHFEASVEKHAIPEFNTDPAQTRASMDKIETLLKTETATLWIEHNMALANSLELAPASYD